MKPRDRKRYGIRWTRALLAATALLIALWATSAWARLFVECGDLCVGVQHGQVGVAFGVPQILPVSHLRPWGEPSLEWGFEADRTGTPPYIVVPLWFPTLLAGAATLVLWMRHRRYREPGACTTCGYDLSGLAPSAACPECGQSGTGRGPAVPTL